MTIVTRELWEEGRYLEAVKIGLQIIEKTPRVFKNSDEFAFHFLSISYAALSAQELRLYLDEMKLYKKLFDIVPIEAETFPCSLDNFICHLQRYLESLLYYWANEKREYNDILQRICHAIRININRMANGAQKTSMLDHIESIQPLVEEFKNGAFPYYEYNFKIPFAIPLPEGDYPISNIGEATLLNIKHVHVVDSVAIDGSRFFSKVTIRVKGFTATDAYWRGPSESMQGYQHSNMGKALEIVNLFNLYILNAQTDSFIARVTENHIGQFQVNQFSGTGNKYRACIGLGFGGDALANVINDISYIDEEKIKILKSDLTNNEPLPLYRQLILAADINMKNGLSTESFYIVSSAMEAMINFYCLLISEKHNLVSMFDDFMQGTAFCDNCSIVEANPDIIIPTDAPIRPPTVFSYSKFLVNNNIINRSQGRTINGLLSQIRQDKCRNDLMHGRGSFIAPEIVAKSRLSFTELERLMQKLVSVEAKQITPIDTA